MPLTSTYCNTLINPTTVICYNCKKKNGYFTLSCLELKNTNNIKEIKEIEEDVSKKLEKENF